VVFSDVADFHSPWKLSPNSPHYNGGNSFYYCVERTLALYQDMGIAPKKLAMGIPNYARSMIVNQLGEFAGLYQPVVGTPLGDFGNADGLFSWDTINKFLNHQPSELDKLGVKQWHYYDSDDPICKDAQMCLLSGELPDGRWVVVNFVDQTGGKFRAQQVKSLGLGGAMVWANYEEPKQHSQSITAAISDGLDQSLHQVSSLINTPVTPSAPPLSNDTTTYSDPPPSYEEATHPKGVNNLHNQNLSDDEPLYFNHLRYLSTKAWFADEKASVMQSLFFLRFDTANLQRAFDRNKDTLSQHRNIFKRAVESMFGDVSFFNKPKSYQLAEKLLHESQDNASSHSPISSLNNM